MSRSLSAVFAVVACIACSGSKSPPHGEVLVRIESNLAIPEDWDTLGVEVQARGAVLLANRFPITPEQQGMPATLGLLQGPDPSTPVTVRASAYKGTNLLVAQQFVTQIP